MSHIMLDLETMGTHTNAPITAIGAVVFDERGIQASFYRVIDFVDCVKRGFTIDPSTVLWWMKQSEEARSIYSDEEQATSMKLKQVLKDFNEWADENAGLKKNRAMWGNGADFDNVILVNACNQLGVPHPWMFRNNRCYRTIKNTATHIRVDRSGVYHNALDDAVTQAKHLIEIDKEMGLNIL